MLLVFESRRMSTGELLRELTIDPSKDHQPRTPK